MGVLRYPTFPPVMLSRLLHAARLASTWKKPRSHWLVMKIDQLKGPLEWVPLRQLTRTLSRGRTARVEALMSSLLCGSWIILEGSSISFIAWPWQLLAIEGQHEAKGGSDATTCRCSERGKRFETPGP